MNLVSIVRRSYQLKINHSETKDMGIGKWVTSPILFRVGRHDWVIKYFPQGDKKGNNGKYLSVFLEMQRAWEANVTATFELALLDKQGNVSSITSKKCCHTFTSRESDGCWPSFLERTKLEETYIKDGSFVLDVSITVNDENSYTTVHENIGPISFPRASIQKFRAQNIQTDVTFDVAGTKFVAHRVIVAAHSPVFEAEFFGSMTESNHLKCVTIKEIMPSVFKAMLDFLYNGLLPVNNSNHNNDEVMPPLCFCQNLLAAADRYAVEQLKSKCEHKLIESISLDTVFTLLELAEKHNCSKLKVECIQFAVDKKNWVSLLFSEGYIKLMQTYPSLLGELKKMADM